MDQRERHAGCAACFSHPQPAIDREWQTACGTRKVVLGDSVEPSLRNKWGEPGEAYDVAVRVIDPEGTEMQALTSLVSDEDGIAIYPDDFPSASSGLRWARCRTELGRRG